MKKNGIIVGLVVVVAILVGYIIQQNQKNSESPNLSSQSTPVDEIHYPDGGPSVILNSNAHQDARPDDYLVIPELQIRFAKIPGLRLEYQYDSKNKTVSFTSLELNAAGINDPSLSYCVSHLFANVAISTTSRDKAEYQGYGQKDLGDGRYLNIYGSQSVCYTDTTSQTSKDFIIGESKLFVQFLDTVQNYY